MIVTYDVYKRDKSTGKRYELFEDFSSFSITLNWRKRSKFSMSGSATKSCPFDIGESIVFYRNSKFLFSGMVERVETECEDVISESIEWEISGRDDGLIFDWRVILTDYDPNDDFEDLTFDGETYDKYEGFAYDRLVHYIRNCFGPETMSERLISGLQFPVPSDIPESDRGESALSAYRLKKLSDVLSEIGSEDELFPQYNWNPTTGVKKIEIPIQRDLSGSIVISPQFGNVASWSCQKTYPKCNALWVCSGEYSEEIDGQKYTTRMWVYMEDAESIKKYGRIESIMTKSDIKITEDDKETEEDETLTEEDVIELLTEEARKKLQDSAAKEKYTVTLAETDDLQFMVDWQCGDKVTVVIDNKRFTSTIETVSISYQNLVEKLKPTIGAVEEGIFSEIFDMISGIDKRLENEEES